MTNRKKSLITWGVSAIVALSTVSCIEVDKTLGSGYIPTDYDLALYSGQLDVPVEMKMSDSLQTMYSGYYVFGSYRDQLFGEVDAASAFSVIPSIYENDFGDAPTVKYLRMYITINSHSIFNSWEASIPQNIYLYKLTKEIDTLKPYNNSYTVGDYDPVPINEETVYIKGDSIVFDIDKTYAEELLKATKLERDSANHFLKRFKGFYLRTDPMPGSLIGGRLNLVSAGNIYMVLNYRHKSAADNIDTDSLVTYYTSESVPYASWYKHSTKSMETSSPSQKVYIEGMAGIKPYIDFTNIKTAFDSWAQENGIDIKRVIFSKAELVLPYEFPSDYKTMNQFPSKIFLATRVRDTTTNLRYYQPVSDIYLDGSDGEVDRVNFDYRINITTYLQKVITNRHKDASYLKTWVFPVMASSSTSSTSYYVENTAYYKAILNGNLAQRKPHLEFTYSILK